MPESSPNPAEEGHPFDVERFARETVHAVEYGDATSSVTQERLMRVEECIAARWPRRWLLWARLRRELRASAATWNDAYIDRKDFLGRRSESVSQMINDTPEVRWHREGQTTGFQRHTGWDSSETGQPGSGEPLGPPWNMPGDDGPQQGDTDPGAGFLS